MRAAQYVRMSTEHQQYSLENQTATIAEYAFRHNFEIVRTYSDEARSGIDLAHRRGLRQLIDDIVTLRSDFERVLVYDVSRWGRFQDSDESAHYEFLCKSAGVKVVYCAEPFADDDSLASSLLKNLKRAMAGEYLRELSAKVFAGQCTIARKGYKLGGSAGYGLRRMLLDANGNSKQILGTGERKCLAAERVTYVLGPASELRIVRKIYSLFLEHDLSCNGIAKQFNRLKIPRENSKRWTGAVVQRILSHPKYTGCIVFNQKSGRLRSKVTPNPMEQWVIEPGRFPAIMSRSRFEEAQAKLKNRVFLRSDEQLLLELRLFVARYGAVTKAMLACDKTMATANTYEHRFGSFLRALAMIKAEPQTGFSQREQRFRIKTQLRDEFAGTLASARVPFKRNCGLYTSEMHHPMLLDVARCITLLGGEPRWEIRYSRKGGEGLSCIAARLDPDNKSVTDYVFIPRLPKAAQRLRLAEEALREIGFLTPTLAEAIRLLLAKRAQNIELPPGRRLW